LAALAVIPLVAVALWLAHALSPYQGYSGRQVTLVIPPGASGGKVAEVLHESGVIRSAPLFRALLRVTGSAGRLQAGEYRFSGPMGPLGVRRLLVQGNIVLHQITVPEGLRLDQTFALFVSRGLGTLDGFQEASRRTEAVQPLDPEAEDLEGYLYPDTYRLPRAFSEEEILGAMVDRFLQVFGEPERERAAELGMSPRQVVTLASLVERETSDPSERELVSAVFHNRLRRGMLLQCDPTVIFALIREGLYDGRLTRSGLELDSPYNTYLHPGLPPGPIASPGAESLFASLHPADTDYLYFVSMNTGRHHFSRSLDEHRRAVNRYQRNGRGR
jgi:UPF0755 protein